MNSRIEMLLDRYVVKKEHRALRQERSDPFALAEEYCERKLTDLERSVERLRYVLDREQPAVYPDERIGLIRTVPVNYEIFTEEEWKDLRSQHYIHEQGKVCNINPRYSLLLDKGFDRVREEIRAQIRAQKEMRRENTGPEGEAVAGAEIWAEAVDGTEIGAKAEAEAGTEIGAKGGHDTEYLNALLEVLDIIEAFAGRYAAEAERKGNLSMAAILRKIPASPPENFQEALQFLRLLHYCLWCSFNYHNTFGRFDQYMYPYYRKDVEQGRLTEEEALELLEEFFISCNKDSDLYPGMQQGDNGQSMVLGGLNPDGSESFNGLSKLCLQASLELKLIDPKINLRVNRNTPLSMYEMGTELTRQGLGFPQYANDDVVIPCLKHWGYREEDAYNYVVAACWEFIIPGSGMDIPNVNGLSFSGVVLEAMEGLKDCGTFEELMGRVRRVLFSRAETMCDGVHRVYMEPAPLMSLMMDGCVERARDISRGGVYNNYGFHGTGLSTAVDSLAAIRKYVYEDKKFSAGELLDMLDADFKGYEEIQNMLRYEGPKMGNDDDEVDGIATQLLDWFADALEGKHNDMGGIFRAGTGSAMYYVWHSREELPTPDGRNRGEELACNYSPSLFTRLEGPVSIIKSFSKPHLERVANGGPLTIELHDNMFRNSDSIRKVAVFVKSFMDMGGHQMQINAVNRDTMLDAKAHPEKHKNLIVRVWGWSGYFVELDEVYQNQIIKRMELSI